MADYAPITDFSAKDALTSGDPEKIILGADVDAETDAIATAIATKYDSDDLASQAQAETGTNNATLMTPLRTSQRITAIFPNVSGQVTPTHTELNYVDGVTSAIQTQLDAKLASASYTAADVLSKLLTVDGAGSGLDADLLDGNSSAAFAQLSASNTFTTGQIISAAVPYLRLTESDAAANNQRWYAFANGGVFNLAASSDADSHTSFLTVARSGVEVTAIALAADSITLNGVASTDYARLSQVNTFTTNSMVQSFAGSAYHVFQNTNASITATVGASSAGAFLQADTNHPLDLYTNGTSRLQIAANGNFDFKGGTVTTNNGSADEVGYKGIPQRYVSDTADTVLADANKCIILQGGSGSKTVTIAENEVNYPDGTTITFINVGGGTLTIANDETMYLAGTALGTTGSRSLANGGVATAYKVTTSLWIISGTGLS